MDPRALVPAVGTDAWDLAPVGLAVVGPDGAIEEINAHGRDLLRDTDPTALLARALAGGLVDGQREQTLEHDVDGQIRVLSCRLASSPSGAVLAFQDVTRAQQRQRRIAAVARAAASVASERSLSASLDAMAREVLRADGLAGVQILASVPDTGEGLRVMGTAGFESSPRFFELIMACRDRGASLRMIEAFDTGRPVVVPHRYDTVMQDPAWEPLHDLMRNPRWDSFAAVPLLAGGRRVGILNAFFSPGQEADDDAMGFLQAMADQATLAIDYAQLLEQQHRDARQAERQLLARELHDSIVQQVFSIGMQTEVLKLLTARPDDDESRARIPAVAQDLEGMSRSVLADLRNVVTQLHPASPTTDGLATALRVLVESTRRRTGVAVSLVCAPEADELDAALAEDVYFIAAEAVHNAVKHAQATEIAVELRYDVDDAVRLEVSDDGTGFDPMPERWEGGYGLTSMRQRAERWGASLEVEPDPARGTRVLLCVPHVSPGLRRWESAT